MNKAMFGAFAPRFWDWVIDLTLVCRALALGWACVLVLEGPGEVAWGIAFALGTVCFIAIALGK